MKDILALKELEGTEGIYQRRCIPKARKAIVKTINTYYGEYKK